MQKLQLFRYTNFLDAWVHVACWARAKSRFRNGAELTLYQPCLQKQTEANKA